MSTNTEPPSASDNATDSPKEPTNPGSNRQPSDSGDQPSDSGDQPSGSGDQPSGSGDQPSGSGAQPSGSAPATYDDLSFTAAPGRAPADPRADRADSVGSSTPPSLSAAAACAHCKAALNAEYYTVNDQMLCPACHAGVRAALEQSRGSLGQALLFGGLAALAGAAVYYGIVALTGYELGLIAIVVGVVVGKGVRRGAGTRNHWLYRGLAVGLTWLSIVATYIPSILEAMEVGEASAVALLVAAGLAVVAPFLMLFQGEFMAIVILAIGLWEAWRYSAPRTVKLEGPFRLATGAQNSAEASVAV